MLTHYLKLTFRTLARNRFHSAINIFGLALGMACSIVIMLFVYGEWSYDRGFAKADRIHRIGISFFNIGTFANGPEQTLEVLSKEFPGMETGTRIRKDRDVLLQYGDKTLKEFAYYTDTAFFKVFDFQFVAGGNNALSGPQEIILTEEMAGKLFGKTDVMGETVLIGKEKLPYQVTGIVKDPGFNTHINAKVWISNKSKLTGSPVWSSAAFHTYVLLKENVTTDDLRLAMDRVIDDHVFPESGKPMGFKTLEDYRKNDMSVKFYVHPLKDIYLQSKLNAELTPGGNEANITIFSSISLFILLLAAVNFVNLTTAKAARRAKEVGVRKVLGTSRSKLASQFLLESMLTTAIAVVLAIVLSEMFLVVFEYVTGTPLMTTLWRNPFTLPLIVLFALVVGFVSGIYPSFYLTAFKPVNVLKGNLTLHQGFDFRNLLVVFQFTVAIALVVASLVIQQQLHFMQFKDLGFDQENVLTVDGGSKLKTSAEAFKNELSAEPGVIHSSFHVGEPGSKRILTFYTYQTPGMDHPITVNTYFGDDQYIPLCGIRLIKGRNFSRDLASDTSAVILNEAAVAALGLPEDPIGAKVNENQTIIGVVSDFHWESLRTAIQPTAFVYSKDPTEIGFKLEGNAIPAFIKAAEAKWKLLVPDEPFKYHFLDENFAELLQKEAVLGKAINLFTLLAIFISCLGLYGLSAHTAETRTKEIGIRKVMGATVTGIVVLISRDFTRLVLIAFVIAAPLGWYFMNNFLEQYSYRVDMSFWVIALAGIVALSLTLLIVGAQAMKSAVANPTKSLRSE